MNLIYKEGTINGLNVNIGFFQLSMNILFLIILFAVLTVSLLVYRKQNKKIVSQSQSIILMDQLLGSINMSNGAEANLNTLLGILRSLFPAQDYFFYIIDENHNCYALKAMINSTADPGDIRPSYSGLSDFAVDTYSPQVSLPVEEFPESVTWGCEGNETIVKLPVTGGKGMIHIRLLPGTSVKNAGILELFGEKVKSVLDVILGMESEFSKHEYINVPSFNADSKAVIAVDFDNMSRTLLNVSIRAAIADGGLFIRKENSEYDIPVFTGLDKHTENLFKLDTNCHNSLFSLMGSNKILTLKKDDRKFFHMPSYLESSGVELLILINVKKGEKDGLMVYWYKNIPNLDRYRITTMMMLSKRMGDILESHSSFKELADSYSGVLKMLCQTLDSINSNTVGYSELMSRYALIICRELKLSEKETQEIALAAYLSNIGILGLKSDIISNKGKYSVVQFETMKQHVLIGASIIETTLANKNIAKYIRFHHERVDGHGYPNGLKGKEIPLGARIIAVVQSFMAKIMGRSNREPLPFEKALEILSLDSGSQLDGDVVEALVRWFRKKQEPVLNTGRSLGPCWEMRCSPSSICSRCPAYKSTGKNCWEFDGVNCIAHGNRCRSCFIYTEAIYRKGLFIANK